MRKYGFWIIMCLLSLLNGAFFFLASLSAMERGVEGVDNQAALLLIPLFWIAAAMVLLVLNGCTLLWGRKIRRDARIHFLHLFRLASLDRREFRRRMIFFTVTGLLTLLAYLLFAGEGILAAAYALSGGLLLLDLYIWQKVGASPSGC